MQNEATNKIKKYVNAFPGDFVLTKLGDIGSFRKGKGIRNDDISASGLQCITYGHIYTKHNEIVKDINTFISKDTALQSEKIFKGEVLFACSGETQEEIGKATMYMGDEHCFAGGDILILHNEADIDSKYLAYSLHSEVFHYQRLRLGQGQSVVHIHESNLRQIEIPIPPKNDQVQIGNILYAWDTLLDLKRSLLKEKKELYKLLSRELVTGKRRLPGVDLMWRTHYLREVYNRRKEYSAQLNGYTLYSLTIEGGVTEKTDRYDREFLVKGDNKKYLISHPNDLVFNPQNLRYGAISTNKNTKEVLVSPIYESLFIADSSKFNWKYFELLLTSEEMIKFYGTKAEGTLVERMAVKADTFLGLAFKVPDISEQNAIVAFLSAMQNEILLVEKEIDQIGLQKKGLMQQLLTGKLRVKVT